MTTLTTGCHGSGIFYVSYSKLYGGVALDDSPREGLPCSVGSSGSRWWKRLACHSCGYSTDYDEPSRPITGNLLLYRAHVGPRSISRYHFLKHYASRSWVRIYRLKKVYFFIEHTTIQNRLGGGQVELVLRGSATYRHSYPDILFRQEH